MRASIQRLRREQAGLTLPELLTGTMLGLLVLGAAFTFFAAVIKAQPATDERAATIGQARVAMERISRELRQGYGIPVTGSTDLAILTYVKRASCGSAVTGPAIPCRVLYSCSAGTCTRSERTPSGGGSAPVEQVVTGLAEDAVFSYTLDAQGSPTYVGVQLVFPASGGDGESITLRDGVALRNPPLGGPTG